MGLAIGLYSKMPVECNLFHWLEKNANTEYVEHIFHEWDYENISNDNYKGGELECSYSLVHSDLRLPALGLELGINCIDRKYLDEIYSNQRDTEYNHLIDFSDCEGLYIPNVEQTQFIDGIGWVGSLEGLYRDVLKLSKHPKYRGSQLDNKLFHQFRHDIFVARKNSYVLVFQ